MTEPVYEVTVETDEPFFTGTQIAREIDYSMPVSVAGVGFLVDLDPNLPTSMAMSRVSIDLTNTQTSDSGDDRAALSPEVWRRVVESWHQGSGQSRFDRSSSLAGRFAASRNVKVWDKWKFSLLNATENIQAVPSGSKTFLTTVGSTRFVAVVDDQSWWFTDPTLPATTFAFPEDVLDVCSDGANLYTVDRFGDVRRYTGPTTGTLIGTVPSMDPTRPMLAYVKGFIVAAGGGDLYDMTAGTPTLIYRHPLEGFTWVDACDGLAAAYLIGGLGDKWHVYGMTINDDATTFEPPIQAAPIPEGEVGYALASYLGYILIGTSTGWRFGVPAGDGTLTFGQLVQTTSPVRCFEGQDKYVWYGLEADDESGLGSADLSQFVAPMTPAYAADLTADSAGSVRGVITYGTAAGGDGTRVFIIEGVGVYAETPGVLAAEGFLETGLFTFNSSDPKMGLYLQGATEPLEGGAVDVDVKFDSDNWTNVAADLSRRGSVSFGNIALLRQFNVLDARVTLYRDELDASKGPVVQRLEIRAINIPGNATQFRLPLILASDLYDDGTPHLRDAAADYQFLMDLVRTREQFIYREAAATYRVHATDFLWMSHRPTGNGQAYEGLYLLTMKEIR